MKVILLQDVARLGRKHEVKEVPDGHAQNFLIPRKMATPATHKRVAQLEETAAGRAEAQQASEAQFRACIETDAPLTIFAEANEQGHLFKGVHASDIAALLSSRCGMTINAAAVSLKKPIKEVGMHAVPVTVGSVTSEVSVTVTQA